MIDNNLKKRAMRDTFLESVYQFMLLNKKIIFVSADFGSPVLDKIRKNCPKQFINVGIAEQNLINISSGLSLEGNIVFAYAIAPFITMRCFEQIRVNLALLSEVRELNVNLIGVGAGYSYVVSGPTHQCYEDISIIRSLPNIGIYSPSDQLIAQQIPAHLIKNKGIKYIRLDAQILEIIDNNNNTFKNGYRVLREGKDIMVVSTGYLTHTAIKISNNLINKGYSVGVIDLINLTEFNIKAFLKKIDSINLIVTMEEGFSGRGGMDSIFLNLFNQFNLNKKIKTYGVSPNYLFEIGTREYIHEIVGIGPKILTAKILKFLKEQKI